MRALIPSLLILVLLPAASARPASAQSAPQAVKSTEISADLGPCSALISITGSDSKPVYGAKVTTRIQYGFLGIKKLDLEAFSGSDGLVKISNLPETLKKPMFIHIHTSEKEEMVEFKPDLRCHATFDVKLQ